MNYIELINRFWKCNNERPIGTNATALYFYLLNLCNSLGWKDTFKHTDRYISFQLGISVNTVRNSKNSLKQLGLIDFRSPQKASRGIEGVTLYSFSTLSNFDIVPDTVVDMVPCIVPDRVADTVPDTLNKLNKTKENNIIKEGENEDFIFPDGLPESDILDPYFNNSIDWKMLLEQFNKITGKNQPAISGRTRMQFLERLREGFTKNDILNTIKNACKDSYHKEHNLKFINLMYISEAKTMEQYANNKHG